jgi:hypothetical protein
MKLKIRFPHVKAFCDYHELSAYGDRLNEIFADNVKWKEIAFYGRYWGVFYYRKKPDTTTLKMLLYSAGWKESQESSFTP